MSDELPEGVEIIDGRELVARAATAVADHVSGLLEAMLRPGIEKFEQSKLFVFPFQVPESTLRKVNQLCDDAMAEVAEETSSFAGSVRFTDLSSQRFDDFLELLSRAGNERDPESLSLEWKIFALTPDRTRVVSGLIEIRFETEQRLETLAATPGDFGQSSIKLSVSGSDSSWVSSTYKQLIPWINDSKLGGIYRPLWIFRNSWFVSIANQFGGWFGFIVFNQISFRWLANLSRVSLDRKYDQITHLNIKDELSSYIKYTIYPQDNMLWKLLLAMVIGAIGYVIFHFLFMAILPKLAPSSNIGIGLAERRGVTRLNTFKFIVFDLLLVAIIIPLIWLAFSFITH